MHMICDSRKIKQKQANMTITAEKIEKSLKQVRRERDAWENSTSRTGINQYRLMCILESLLEDLGPEGIDIQDEIK
ncbi:hypothetical protein OIU82_00005 [Escherichia coli]|nr:hypothetical protein AUQ20_24965 [Escherichia coli]MCW0143933.1 hypothetical protein [Escherichia coli]